MPDAKQEEVPACRLKIGVVRLGGRTCATTTPEETRAFVTAIFAALQKHEVAPATH
jgi:hypothetical protein